MGRRSYSMWCKPRPMGPLGAWVVSLVLVTPIAYCFTWSLARDIGYQLCVYAAGTNQVAFAACNRAPEPTP